MDFDSAYRKIDNADIVSFDVFDTLLLRPFSEPTDIFRLLEQKYDKPGFMHKRIVAENKARRKKNEPTIDDIYSEIPLLSDCKEIELKLEWELLYRNERGWDLYQYAKAQGKKIVIVSDMYLSSSFISNVLEKNEFCSSEIVYVSCEYGKSKREGDLYEVVKEQYPLSKYSIVHIGDNITSDYCQARKQGLSSIHIPKLIDEYLNYRNFREKDINSLAGSVFVKLCADRYSKGFNDYWEQFGYEFAGPLCFAFSRWILANTTQTNNSQICFVARDGYLLKKIYEVLNCSKDGLNARVLYIFAPRIIAIVSSITSEDDLDKLSDKHKELIADYFSIISNESIEHTAKNPIDYVNNNKTIIMEYAKKMMYEFKKYLKTNLLTSEGEIYLVDSRTEGFSAQLLVEKAIGKNVSGLYYVVGQDNNNFEYKSYQRERQNVYLNWQIIEYVMSAPTPPILGVSDGKPIYGKMTTYEKERINKFGSIEKGVLEFVSDMKKREILDIEISELEIRNWVNNFCLYGNANDRKSFSDVLFANNATHTEYVKLNLFSSNSHRLKEVNVRDRFFRWLTLHPSLYGKAKKIYSKIKFSK